jgi:uncharacterized SAM-binding protein YcdF (DUF218 family)
VSFGVNLEILKPLLSTLVLPPAGPLLLLVLGVFVWKIARKAKLGAGLIVTGFVLLWLLSCQSVAVKLNAWLLKSYPVATAELANSFNAQAIVILGGGIQLETAEYQQMAQISATAATRLRYGAWLSKQTRLPLAYSGGQTEALGAANYLKSFDLPVVKWLGNQSSDTADNAQEMAKMLPVKDINRIVLVTHAWHMERSVKLFEAQGFTVLPAPVYAIAGDPLVLLDWLPSTQGLHDSRTVLREALGLLVLRIKG